MKRTLFCFQFSKTKVIPPLKVVKTLCAIWFKTYSVKIENPSSPEREKIERLVFLLLRRPASFVGAGTLGVRGVLRFSFDSLEDVAVCLIFRCRGGSLDGID